MTSAASTGGGGGGGGSSANLFKLDVLPPLCSVVAEFDSVDVGMGSRMRFQAVKGDDTHSEWSGWFTYEGAPIALSWSAFWAGTDA